jgi:predicted dehydrogenase
MNGDRKLRVGVVGSGFGGIVHVPSFRAQGGFEVVAVASPSRAAEVARERKVPHAFASTRDMLDGVELDVVSVASPPFDHRESVLLALARGKHVLCEKPFGLDVAQAEEMLAASERAGTVCALAHEFRFAPSRLAVKELIENGHLGALREIEATTLLSFLRAERHDRKPGWWFEAARGGGITGALLSHLIDMANWLAGRAPLHSTGFGRTANPVRTYEGGAFTSDAADGAFALLDYGDGLVARLTADGTAAVESTTLAVHGEDRAVAASGPDIVNATMFAIDDEETSELTLRPQKHANFAALHPNVPMFVALLDEFAAAIAGKPAHHLPSFADGLATQRVLAAAGYPPP